MERGIFGGARRGPGHRLPHTCRELPLHCIDPDDYQMLCGYRRRLDIPAGLAGKLDTSENPAVPPFGFVVDYLTYGGLYREA